MKRTLFISILIVLFTVSFVGCDNQTSTKEQSSITDKNIKQIYDLQERCGKQSEEWFKKKYGNGYEDEVSTEYYNHYNIKQNKCFILVTQYHQKKKSITVYMTGYELYDVNENNEYGSLTIIHKSKKVSGWVLGKSCETEDEWFSIVLPYMKE